MTKSHTVIVYSTEWCPWCHRTKDFLTKNKIPFEDRDVEKNPEYAEELQAKSHQTSIPVTDIDGQVIIGFNEPALRKALGL